MKVSVNLLRQFIDLPSDWEVVRDAMEDAGLEVKRAEPTNDDVIFTLELLANRGDHHSYQGIARELHGRTAWPFHKRDVPALGIASETHFVNVVTSDCLTYCLAEFFLPAHEQHKPVPTALQKMVELSGANAVLPVVDVSNLLNIEIGQPLHVFDADKIDGALTVRLSTNGERAMPLFAEEALILPEGTMVIADNSKIVAIAGVMGCQPAAPTEDTRRIYIESATFDPVKIRKTARQLRMQSLAATRFERGSDPSLTVQALDRAGQILHSMGWLSEGKILAPKLWQPKSLLLSLSVERLNAYFDSSLSRQDIALILRRYGFDAIGNARKDQIDVQVPPHRYWDVQEVQDLYEEIAKGIGYNSLPSSLPSSAAGVLPSPELSLRRLIDDLLVGEGFYEVFTDGFYGEKHRARLGISEDHPLWNHVRTINAEDKAYSLLKNNCLAQAVELVQTNINVRNPNIKAYEWTRTFHPSTEADNGLCEERLVLWMVASGNVYPKTWDAKGKEADVFYMKGIVEEIANLSSLPLEVKQFDNDGDISPTGSRLHPTRRASIVCEGRRVGILGEVHPDILSLWGVKYARPCFVELSQDILKSTPSVRQYVPPANIHPIIRDVCLLIPHGLAARDVADYMCAQSDWLDEVDISDVYKSIVTDWKNAVTFSFHYNPSKAGKTHFTGDEINRVTDGVVTQTIRRFRPLNLERR